MTKIGILSLTQILFIIIIFSILIYLQSQQTLLGNTINIAGKNRYLTSNLLIKFQNTKVNHFHNYQYHVKKMKLIIISVMMTFPK
jgi:hypothetical protein